MLTRVRHFLVLLLSTLIVAGCGVRMVYSQLDWLVPWYLGDFVTLDTDQKQLLDARLAERLAWHCDSQLGPYSELLRDLDKRLREERPLSALELEAYLERSEVFWRELMIAIRPDAQILLATLTDEQVAELGDAFARRNRETREEFLEGTPEELRERQVERMEKRLRTWLGRLQPEQRRMVERWSANLAPTTGQWLGNRELWQRELIAALAQRQQPGFGTRLESLLLAPEARWAEDYRRDVAHNRALTVELVVELANSANADQRTKLSTELTGWASQFEQIACERPSAAEEVLARAR